VVVLREGHGFGRLRASSQLGRRRKIGSIRDGFLPWKLIAPLPLLLKFASLALIPRGFHLAESGERIASFPGAMEIAKDRSKLIPRHDSKFFRSLRISCQPELLDRQLVLTQFRFAFPKIIVRVAD